MKPGLVQDEIIDHPVNKFNLATGSLYANQYADYYFGECGMEVNYHY